MIAIPSALASPPSFRVSDWLSFVARAEALTGIGAVVVVAMLWGRREVSNLELVDPERVPFSKGRCAPTPIGE
jgi:hypothetical protein